MDANRGRDNPKVDGQRKRSDVRRGEIRRTKKCLPEFNRRFLIGAGGFFRIPGVPTQRKDTMSTKLSRRHFLITGASALAACFLPADILRRARQYRLDHDDVLIEEPDRWTSTLYANPQDSNVWQFSLDGRTGECPEAPTWRDWLENYEAIDTHDRNALADWIRKHRSWRGISPRSRDWLEMEVSPMVWASYLEGQYAYQDSPEARALEYLSGLKLANGPIRDEVGRSVGDLKYYHGVHPGNDWHFAEAEGELVLPALQHRLRELGEKTHIVLA